MRVLLCSFACVAAVSVAHADVDIKFGGMISSDIRFRLNGGEVIPADQVQPYPSQYRLLNYGFSRNENIIKAQLSLRVSQKVKAVADVDFYWYGYSDLNNIDMTTLRESNDPFRVDSYAAYIDIYRILPKLDLRIGRQVVTWGSADKFNPTNNVNSLDLSDPLLFGRALANQMVRLDYNPYKDLIITAVWVPIFRPAQLPRTAPFALKQIDRPAPVQELNFQNSIYTFAELQPPKAIDVVAMQPNPSIDNSQFGGRIANRFGPIDVGLSYYYGRWMIPTLAFTANQADGTAKVGVMWPRMQVLGLDLAGSIEKLRGMGWWIETAVFFPQEVTYALYNDHADGTRDPLTIDASGNLKIGGPEGSGKRATVIPAQPFVKLTAGVDLTITKWLYMNLQYVYGFIDEFGAGKQTYPNAKNVFGTPRSEARIGHYLVVGGDLKFFSDALLIRLFAAFKVPQIGDEGPVPGALPPFTAVLFPQIAWAVWDATELSVGAFVFLGDRSTKFGDPAAGASEIFMKAKFTY